MRMLQAADELRDVQTKYMSSLEENVVFATTRRVLGLGPVLNGRLKHLQELVVEKFDVLDMLQARSDRQMDAFDFALSALSIGVGVVLMNMRVTEDSELVSVKLPSICIGMSGESSSASSSASAPRYRLDLPTLFAFISGVSGLLPVSSAVITCMRTIQVGKASLARVSRYLNVDAEPFEEQAQEERDRRLALPLLHSGDAADATTQTTEATSTFLVSTKPLSPRSGCTLVSSCVTPVSALWP